MKILTKAWINKQIAKKYTNVKAMSPKSIGLSIAQEEELARHKILIQKIVIINKEI